MSGHGGFSAISGNMGRMPVFDAPKIVDLKLERPKAEGLTDAKPAVPVETARRIAGKLDALLLQASKSASAPVDAKALKTALGAANLDKATRTAIENAAKRADTTFKAIDKFTGREIALAMVKNDGVFDWDGENPAGVAIQAALDAQAELSELLGKALNHLPPTATAAAQTALEEAMLKTDRRASEIQTLFCEFADLAEKAGNDPEIKARLEQTLESLIPSQSLKMHGNEKIATSFKDSLAPLAKKIDDLAAAGERQLSGAEETKIRRQIDEAFNAFVMAERPYAKKGIQLDRSLMESAKGLFRDFTNRLTDIRREAALATMRNFADKTFGMPDIALFQPKFRPFMKAMYPMAFEAMGLMRGLKEATDEFLAHPNDKNLQKMRAFATDLSAFDSKKLKAEFEKMEAGELPGDHLIFNLCYAEREDLDQIIASLPRKDRKACTDELKAEFRTAVQSFLEVKLQAVPELRTVLVGASGVSTQVDHLVTMYSNASKMGSGAFLTNKTLESAFEGKTRFSTLVETRLCGLPDQDADPALDDANAMSDKPLGSGAVNTVYEVKYQNDTSFIFKPEAPGREGLESLNLAHEGYKSFQMVAPLNMATQRTADAFGLGDVTTKTSVGSHNGRFGIFMEKAPGEEASFFKHEEAGKPGGTLDAAGIKALDDAQYERVVGDLMRQTNRLEWADILTGQGDRHSGNYLINIDVEGTVTVKGIDNDACFSSYAIGMRKYKLTGSHAKSFEQRLEAVATKLYPRAVKSEQIARINDDPGVSWESDGSIVVNAALVKNPEILACLQQSLGLQTAFLPTVMDEEFYTHLMEMESGAARDIYIADLQARLPKAAVDAAIRRLDDTIAYARLLKQKGRVLSTQQWRRHDIQRVVAGKMPPKDAPAPLPKVGGMDPVPGELTTEVTKKAHAVSNNLFRRDLMAHIAKPGWFDE